MQFWPDFNFGDFWACFWRYSLAKREKIKPQLWKWKHAPIKNGKKPNWRQNSILQRKKCIHWRHQHLPQVHQVQCKDTTLVAQKPHITSNQEGGVIQFSDHYPPPYAHLLSIQPPFKAISIIIISVFFCLLMFATTWSTELTSPDFHRKFAVFFLEVEVWSWGTHCVEFWHLRVMKCQNSGI